MNPYIKEIFKENTGGGCMVDLLFLHDGRVIGINDGCIVLYPSRKAFYEGNALGNFDFPVIFRPKAPTTIQSPRLGVYTDELSEEYTVTLISLDTGEVVGIDTESVCLYPSMSSVFEGAPASILGCIPLSKEHACTSRSNGGEERRNEQVRLRG